MEIGQKFGCLTVVGFSTRIRRGYNSKSVLCTCDCGRSYEGYPSELRSGKVASCGCKRDAGGRDKKQQDLKGHVYGKLVVLDFAGRVSLGQQGKYRTQWLCECECGNRLTVTSNSLRTGNTRSCGCLYASLRTANAESVVRRMKSRAVRNGKEWKLSTEEAADIIAQRCYYCDAEPKVTGTDKKYVRRNGIDRVDSTKGYITGNVVPCCRRCNIAKNDQTYEEFVNQIKACYNKLISSAS